MGRGVIRGRQPLGFTRRCKMCQTEMLCLRSDRVTCSGKCRIAYMRMCNKITIEAQSKGFKTTAFYPKKKGK